VRIEDVVEAEAGRANLKGLPRPVPIVNVVAHREESILPA
jgi:hypothetical protein